MSIFLNKKINKLLIYRLFSHLSAKRHKQLLLVLILIIFSSFAEALSIISVVPFLAALLEPEKVLEISFVSKIANFLNLTSADQIFFFASFSFVSLTIIASFLKIGNVFFTAKLSAFIGTDLNYKIIRNIFDQNYLQQMQDDNNYLISSNTEYISKTVRLVNSFLLLIASLFILTCLFISIYLVNPSMAIFSAMFFGISYFLISTKTNSLLHIEGKNIALKIQEQFKSLREGYNSKKEIMLYELEEEFAKSYRSIDKPLRIMVARTKVLGVFPKYIVELLAILLITVVAIIFQKYNSNLINIVTSLGTFAIVAQKIIPIMQQIYNSWATYRVNIEPAKHILKLLDLKTSKVSKLSNNKEKLLIFWNKITLKNLSFKYPNSQKSILRDINFEIFKGEKIGLIGDSGSGKSTLIDLIIGLIPPKKGFIYIDDFNLNKFKNDRLQRCWRRSISLVPQKIFIYNKTFAENIALSSDLDGKDFQRIEEAARKADIADFIEQQPQGYLSLIDEKGNNLSGGQIQRIGIARALFKKPQILVLDEVTSSLDRKTAKRILEKIFSIKDLTIIMVDHNTTFLRNCDKIIELKNGKLEYKIDTLDI